MPAPCEKTSEDLPVTSSKPIELPPEQRAMFREVLRTLEQERVPYAVAGGFALQQHTGICRFTKDLDIFLRPADASATLALLEDGGFQTEVCDPVWLAKAYRGDFFVDLITGMSNGTITVDRSWTERARRAEVLGVQSRVLAPEELLASKLFILRRERFDGSDIVHIIYALGPKLNWDRVLELAGDHWELVLWMLMLFRYVYPAETQRVPQSLWKTLLSRFAKELRSPNPKARFRGSLIDDKMFAVDTEEWGLDDLIKEYQERRTKIAAPMKRSA
jgi:Uncharacterised nucleotidyltransferase